MADTTHAEAPVPSGLGGCLARLCWMALGNFALVSSAVFISQHRTSFFSPADIIYWASVAFLLATRYVDIKRFNGRTASGEPASMPHWRRYAGLLAGASVCIWGAAHGLAYLSR